MALASAAGGVAGAADDTTKTVAELERKAAMRLGDEDRAATIAFLHGFIAGKKGQLVVELSRLSEARDKFIDYCLDNPKEKALDILMKYAP